MAASEPIRRHVCVTGMHRSGTSIAMRAIASLGVSLGDEAQLQPAGPDNPAGYWENRFVLELDDDVLARLGGSWDRPPVLDPGWEHTPDLDDLRDRGKAVLGAAFLTAGAPIVAFKDPRLSILLPFWRTVVDVHTTILMVRRPAEVVASLEARNEMPAGHAALLWLRYLLAAMESDPTHLRVGHHELFDDFDATLGRVAGHLGLAAPDASSLARARREVDPSLRHHREAAPSSHDPIGALAEAVWNGGAIDVDALPGPVLPALARGWLRSPADDDELTKSRALVVELTERLRRRKRERMAAEEAL